MRAFLRLIIGNPIATLLAGAIMMVGGVYAAFHMPVDLLPDLAVPVVNIITHDPAAAPEDIELLITRPIEDALRTIPNVERVASTSTEGLSQVTAQFSWGTTVRDARQLVQTRLARLTGRLPAGVIPRLENIGTTLQEVCGYVIYGPGDPIALRNTVWYDLAGRIRGVAGVSSVRVTGGDQRAFDVLLHPEALARMNLSAHDVIAALHSENIAAAAGFIEPSNREYVVYGDARIMSLDDVRSVPLQRPGKENVPLGSVADVRTGQVPRHYVVHGDGVPAIALVVRKQPGANTTRVVDGVDRALERLRSLLPPGTQVKKFYDQSEIIRETQTEIRRDLIIGACLAVLVLYFFLGAWRPTLIVAVTIPLTFLATLSLMHWIGLSLNTITMTALALAVGMIVDDAIVVAENIHRRAGTMTDNLQATIEGTTEIAGADASGTFTTVAAFLPLVIVSGVAAIFLRPFGFTISAALLVSLLLSLTMVPTLLGHGNVNTSLEKNFAGARLLRFLDGRLQSVLSWSFDHKWITIGLTVMFLGLSGVAVFLGQASLLPPIDEGALLIEYVMPPGTSLTESTRIGNALERIALSNPDVVCVYRRTGSPKNSYLIEGVNKGELMIKLKSKETRHHSASEIKTALRSSFSQFPGMVFLYHQPTQEKIDESFSGLPALFGVTIFGTDIDSLRSLSKQLETILAQDPGITNIVNNAKLRSPQVTVRVDHARLARYALTAQDVIDVLQAARFGIEATRIVRQKEEIPVLVKTAAAAPRDLEALKNLPIVTRDGGIIPLERVAHVQVTHTASAITRLNGTRQVTLLAEVKGNLPALAARVREKLKYFTLPQGYSVDLTGQYKILIKTAFEMVLAVLAAILLVYLILAMQFRSTKQPLIILVTVPISLVGALLALFVTRSGIDISVGMGTVTLVGIAVNNAIVLIDYANKRIAAGDSTTSALRTAASVRLRPILLTSLTTIFALLPTAVGSTVGSKIFLPFAVAVIGGLLSGIAATLIVVPTVAALLSHDTPVPG